MEWSSANLPDGAPQNGWYIEVKWHSLNGSVFVATDVEQEGGGTAQVGDDGDEVELEGVVTGVLANNQFTLNGQPVQVSSATEYEHGSPGDIAVGVVLEAEGVISGGVLIADDIEFRPEDSEKEAFEGDVTAIDSVNSSFVVSGETIRVDSRTTWEDEQSGLRNFSLNDLAIGDPVSVHAYDDGNGWLATKVERED